MTGILGIYAGGAGSIITDTFNLTAAAIPSTAFTGFCDGTAGTSGGAGGSVTGGTLTGVSHIAEACISSGTFDRLRIKGFSADPKQAWLVQITINSVTTTGAGASSYNWDAINNCATWQWNTGSPWYALAATYNGNTIKHQLP